MFRYWPVVAVRPPLRAALIYTCIAAPLQLSRFALMEPQPLPTHCRGMGPFGLTRSAAAGKQWRYYSGRTDQ